MPRSAVNDAPVTSATFAPRRRTGTGVMEFARFGDSGTGRKKKKHRRSVKFCVAAGRRTRDLRLLMVHAGRHARPTRWPTGDAAIARSQRRFFDTPGTRAAAAPSARALHLRRQSRQAGRHANGVSLPRTPFTPRPTGARGVSGHARSDTKASIRRRPNSSRRHPSFDFQGRDASPRADFVAAEADLAAALSRGTSQVFHRSPYSGASRRTASDPGGSRRIRSDLRAILRPAGHLCARAHLRAGLSRFATPPAVGRHLRRHPRGGGGPGRFLPRRAPRNGRRRNAGAVDLAGYSLWPDRGDRLHVDGRAWVSTSRCSPCVLERATNQAKEQDGALPMRRCDIRPDDGSGNRIRRPPAGTTYGASDAARREARERIARGQLLRETFNASQPAGVRTAWGARQGRSQYWATMVFAAVRRPAIDGSGSRSLFFFVFLNFESYKNWFGAAPPPPRDQHGAKQAAGGLRTGDGRARVGHRRPWSLMRFSGTGVQRRECRPRRRLAIDQIVLSPKGPKGYLTSSPGGSRTTARLVNR